MELKIDCPSEIEDYYFYYYTSLISNISYFVIIISILLYFTYTAIKTNLDFIIPIIIFGTLTTLSLGGSAIIISYKDDLEIPLIVTACFIGIFTIITTILCWILRNKIWKEFVPVPVATPIAIPVEMSKRAFRFGQNNIIDQSNALNTMRIAFPVIYILYIITVVLSYFTSIGCKLT